MVIEAYHAGRTVPCPWCRGDNEVPVQIDFRTLDRAQVQDESKGGTLLVVAVVGFVFLCLPLEAWVWWSAHGILARAADEGRPADGLVRAARAIALVATVIQGIVAALIVASVVS